MFNTTAKLLAVTLACCLLNVFPASAQQLGPARIRGTIENVDGNSLTVIARDGSTQKIAIANDIVVTGLVKTTLADVKPGSYIGVTGMPQADGSQKAIAIHIFPESARGTAEGFRQYDLRPNSTMTNATVAQEVDANDGKSLSVKYKDGEKKESCRFTRYADRQFCGWRQERTDGWRQDHCIRRETNRRHTILEARSGRS